MIDLEIQVQSEPVTRKFRIRKEVSDEFDLYVKAAQEKTEGADESLVLEAILRNHFKRDKGFKTWMQSRDAQNQVGP
ncbi:hypothetical protein BIU88_09565 [Chlorobaculum limnaeum]|uniref:Uncharacterized protein n=1 Tax=Chlorobaculum limnaeum TaxID=274537 RepID=A0A1D8D2D4_CHLLM|nr:hypothetical protein [Chlorobaculum limnaeum]AOS84353.1 hypothetical protein BIU88_09565 [Chlorobaculum limnaeum]